MIFEEDIFGDDSLVLVLRYGDHTIKGFDNRSKLMPFEKVISILDGAEKVCTFSKKDDRRHIITIPISEDGYEGKVELYVEWHTTYSYEIKANKECKSSFSVAPVSVDSKYSFEQRCKLTFLGLKDQFNNIDAIGELYKLKQRVDKLEIAPTTIIENERQLWTKYIEAQSMIVDKLQEPFYPKGPLKLEPQKNSKGDIIRYKLTLPIENTESETPRAFLDLMSDYSELYSSEIKIDKNGYALLTKEELEHVDMMIQRKFHSSVARIEKISCSLKIFPKSNIDQMRTKIRSWNKNLIVRHDEKDDSVVNISKLDNSIPKLPRGIIDEYGLQLYGIFCLYEKFDEYHHRHFETEKVILENAKFSRLQKDIDKLEQKALAKEASWVRSGDYIRVVHHIGLIYKYDKKEIAFDDQFWNSLRTDFYGLDINSSPKDGLLFLDFTTIESFENKFSFIKSNDKFVIAKEDLNNPRFRVRFYLVENRAKVDSFEFKLEKLKNVEFITNVPGANETGIIFVGNFNGRESTEQSLVFSIPFKFREEKKKAADILELAKDPSFKIETVQANLRGDKVKLLWLTEAVEKLDEKRIDSEEPNKKPVNPRLRDFIFDSSKAEPTYRFEKSAEELKETEEFQALEDKQLLDLNESQMIAVLKALYAKDLCLLQGPPGTGKTTVIAELIWQHLINDQTKRILLTSETNVAVDNALEKLMGSRNVNPELSPYLSIIKPLRFGSIYKFEEDGKKYSVERIEKWLDEDYKEEFIYENEASSLDDATVETEEIEEAEDLNHNAVQQWMDSIANRAMEYSRQAPQYASLTRSYCSSLAHPDGITKRYFKEKYFKHANVIGSTCSSTGSPAFAADYARVFSAGIFEKYVQKEGFNQTISEIKGLLEVANDEENDFQRKARLIIKRIIRENNIKTEDALLDLLSNPTDNVKHFLFNYDLKRLLKGKIIKRFDTILKRLGFDSEEELNHLKTIHFDTVIMDEASKATPPDLVLPLCFGKKCVVIGDHRQLPPMLFEQDFKEALLSLQDEKANALAEEIDKEFLETSQFARLIQNPKISSSIKSVLSEQYRMHPQINDVIKQFYIHDEGGLTCGLDPDLVNENDLGEPESRYHGFYHPGFINENTHVLWVNVDEPEQRSDSNALFNENEVEAVKRVLQYLTHCDGFHEYMEFWDQNLRSEERRNLEKEIGIISFYGQQVKSLKEIKAFARLNKIRIKLDTVDRFQGMERNIVIVSTVRSNKVKNNIGKIQENRSPGFASSPERLNVALSRARRLLIVVGNSDFFDHVKDRNGNLLYHNVIETIKKYHDIVDYRSLIKYTDKK